MRDTASDRTEMDERRALLKALRSKDDASSLARPPAGIVPRPELPSFRPLADPDEWPKELGGTYEGPSFRRLPETEPPASGGARARASTGLLRGRAGLATAGGAGLLFAAAMLAFATRVIDMDRWAEPETSAPAPPRATARIGKRPEPVRETASTVVDGSGNDRRETVRVVASPPVAPTRSARAAPDMPASTRRPRPEKAVAARPPARPALAARSGKAGEGRRSGSPDAVPAVRAAAAFAPSPFPSAGAPATTGAQADASITDERAARALRQDATDAIRAIRLR